MASMLSAHHPANQAGTPPPTHTRSVAFSPNPLEEALSAYLGRGSSISHPEAAAPRGLQVPWQHTL